MNRIVIDANLPSVLLQAAEPAELCDESGRVIGRFLPQPDPAEYGPLEPQVSEEELERRDRSNGKRYTTAEVLRHLESL
jgi:hypothetical protein